MEPAPAPEEQPVGVRTAMNLQELVVELMEADPSLSTVKALKNKIEAVADELSFRVELKELKPKALAKMMGKERSAKPVRAPGPSSQVASPPPGAHVEDGAGSAAASERTAREPAAAAQLEHRAAVAVPLRDYMSGVLIRRGESTALSPLPLIFSYKSEKSLCGAGHHLLEEALNPFVKGCMRHSHPSDWFEKCRESLGRATKGAQVPEAEAAEAAEAEQRLRIHRSGRQMRQR